MCVYTIIFKVVKINVVVYFKAKDKHIHTHQNKMTFIEHNNDACEVRETSFTHVMLCNKKLIYPTIDSGMSFET